MSLFAKLFSDMGLLAVECRPGNRFVPLNDIPGWFLQICADTRVGTPIDIPGRFPFIEHFLQDADAFWQQPNAPRLGSGVWTEIDGEGKQHQLEAYALLYQQIRILLLVDLTQTFDARHQIYQRAREIALAQEKLVAALQREQRKLQARLQEMLAQNAPMAAIAERIHNHASAVMVCKPDGEVELLNQTLMDIYPVAAAGDAGCASVLSQWVREAETLYPEIHRVIDTGVWWEGEFETTLPDGERKWVRLVIGPVLDEQQHVSHLVCVANDISGLREPSAELERVTEYDLTTQLPNRRHFWRVLTREIDACRACGDTLALLYLDVDNFKRVNDSFDHQAGDQLLGMLSSRLARNVKKTDFIAHLGGDEFAVVLRSERRHLDVKAVAERLLGAVRQPLNLSGQTLHVTASLGVACFPDHAADATALMKHADLAMYHAKQMGRNHFQLFTRDLDDAFLNRNIVQKDLGNAIAAHQLRLLYQPQICIGNDAFLRLEALLRWQHHEHGLISPGIFIPVAEESDLINQLGRWVLEQACAQARTFLDRKVPVVMAVNVSARQIRASDFVSHVLQVLEQTGLPPSQLELEITETALLEDRETYAHALRQLQEIGVSIALDDFGSGFSSLNYLKNLPVDRLKIDQVFIQDVPHNEESKTITATIVKLAHELHMDVVAEGVETWEQLSFLREIGCDYAQGFLLFKPLPADEIDAIYRNLSSLRFEP